MSNSISGWYKSFNVSKLSCRKSESPTVSLTWNRTTSLPLENTSVRLLKSVVNFKFSGKVLCSFKSFAKLNWYTSANTGKSDSSLYDHRMEKWTVLSICSAPSDLAERVPSVENDDLIYIGIEAYSAVKNKTKKAAGQGVCSMLLPVVNIKSRRVQKHRLLLFKTSWWNQL